MAAAAARQRMKPADDATTYVRLPAGADRLAAGYAQPTDGHEPQRVDLDSSKPVIRGMPRRVQARATAFRPI
jgi:hypothetical protein